MFCGACLAAEPPAQKGRKHMNFRFFRNRLKYTAVAETALNLVNIPVNLLSAGLLADIVLSAADGDPHAVLKSGLLLALLLAGYKIMETVCRVRLERRRSLAVQDCKLELYRRLLSKPLAVLSAGDSGQMKERLTDDFSTVTDKILSVYPGLFTGCLTAAVYFVFLGRLSWLTAGMLTAIALIQILPPLAVKHYFEKNYKDTRDIEAQLTDLTIEAHHGFVILKLYELKDWYLERLKTLHKAYGKIGSSGIYTSTAEGVLNDFVSMMLKYGTYALTGLLALKNVISLDTGVEAIALSGSFFAAVNTIFSSITRFAVTKEAQTRLLDWMQEEPEPEKRELGSTRVTLAGLSVSFDGRRVLEKTNISFPERGICLIKGANGAGKTTLLKLIAGLVPAGEGDIRVDGASPDTFSDDVFSRGLFYLPQEDADFSLCPEEFYHMIRGKDISSAAAFAGAFGLGDGQLRGTKISELSGGERKKVFLALALAADPKILLLDEPTNSLDEDSKKILIRELKKREGLTLIVTHDPVFDAACDHLFVVREGSVEQIEK